MPWIVAMDWTEAVFVHWPVDAARLRATIPADLAIDEYGGTAWVSVVAFRIAGARPRGAPRALAWRAFPEVNVRTYVSGGGRSGVWFFSLDADSRLAVAVARGVVNLRYNLASVATTFAPGAASYALVRTQPDAPAARFALRATYGGEPHAAAPGSLDAFLAERYCFFTRHRDGRTFRGDVAHAPWPLQPAIAHVEDDGLLAAAGVDVAAPHALAHYASGVSTRGWPLRAR